MEAHIREILGLPYKNIYSYWQHYWRHCIDELTDKDNVSFRIVGPRMLLKDLIEELEGHGLSNQDNISYFKAQIGQLDKDDVVFHSLCHPITVCLLQRLSCKVNKDSSILLCKKILNTIVVKRYFTLIVDWLAKTIDETSENNIDSRKKINDVTHLVIAEYIAEGFVLGELKKYATDIPGLAIAEGGIVMAAPPVYESLKQSDYSSEVEYYAAISNWVKKRDVYKCLDVLKYHYYDTPTNAFFIVRLNGLKGQIDDFIGDINIYSPKKKRYITGEYSLSDIESVVQGRDYVNAAIPIDFCGIDRAKEYAKKKLEEVLDLLMLTYQTKLPITVATNLYAVVSDGNEISMSVSNRGNDPTMASRDEMMRYLDALDLNDVKGEGFKFLTNKHEVLEFGRGGLKIRLKNAAHWYTKAIAAEKDVDVLLYSWFAIEGLLKVDGKTQSEMVDSSNDANSLNVIQEFVTSILGKQYFYGYLRDIYVDFLYKTNQCNNYYDVSKDVISKAGLNLKTGDHYRDGDFLNEIPAIIDCINDDIVKDKLSVLQNFYQNDGGVREYARKIRNDLLMIYRLRNMIVHNAALSCVNIAFFAREAMFIALRVIWYVIEKAGKDKCIEEIVLGAKVDYQVFLANFNEELRKLKDMK